MFVYNITTKPENQIANEWLSWCQANYIPQILATGCFEQARLLQMLEIDNSEGPTYTIQFHAKSKAQYNLFIEKYFPAIWESSARKWGNTFVFFHSLMQVINQCE